MNIKKNQMWAIKDRWGNLYYPEWRKLSCIQGYLALYSNSTNPKYKNWRWHKRSGTSCVKVQLMEID